MFIFVGGPDGHAGLVMLAVGASAALVADFTSDDPTCVVLD